MPEFFLELFSEEIPARMQARAAEDLVRLVTEALASLKPAAARSFYGPRRIAMTVEVTGEVAASSSVERGPRASAPEQALAGFLRKHGATREQLRQEGDFWVLERASASKSAAELIAIALPALLRRFPGRNRCDGVEPASLLGSDRCGGLFACWMAPSCRSRWRTVLMMGMASFLAI